MTKLSLIEKARTAGALLMPGYRQAVMQAAENERLLIQIEALGGDKDAALIKHCEGVTLKMQIANLVAGREQMEWA